MEPIDFSFSFDAPVVDSSVHYEKTNILSKRELEAFNSTMNTESKHASKVNPFAIEMVVSLNLTGSKRYQFIINSESTKTAKISAILGKNYVNISSWDTYPNVIKNVPISDLVLHPKESIKNKLKVLFIKLIRKVLFIK